MESGLCWVPGCAEGSERARHFVRLWTLKEAYVKAVGRGIGARPGLRAFSVALEPSTQGMSAALPCMCCVWAVQHCLQHEVLFCCLCQRLVHAERDILPEVCTMCPEISEA